MHGSSSYQSLAGLLAAECPVCFRGLGGDDGLEEVAVYGGCGHALCAKCATQWAYRSAACPLCRTHHR